MVYWLLLKKLTQADLINPIEGNPGFFYENIKNFCFVDLTEFSLYAKLENRLLGMNKKKSLSELGIASERYKYIRSKKEALKLLRGSSASDIFVFQSLADIRTILFLNLVNAEGRQSLFLNHWKIPMVKPLPEKHKSSLIKKIFKIKFKLFFLRLLFKNYLFFLNRKKQSLTWMMSCGNTVTEKAIEKYNISSVIPVHSVTYNEYLQTCRKHTSLIKEPYLLFIDQALTIHPDNKNFKPEDSISYRDELKNALEEISAKNNGIKIVIAAHPRCQYEKSFWAPYDVYLGQTANLIVDAQAVAGHFSTSLALAQIYGKKIYLLQSSSPYFPFNAQVAQSAAMLDSELYDMRTMEPLKRAENDAPVNLTDYLTLLPESRVENNSLFMDFFKQFDIPPKPFFTCPKYQFYEKNSSPENSRK